MSWRAWARRAAAEAAGDVSGGWRASMHYGKGRGGGER
jgi:hypothetical protein